MGRGSIGADDGGRWLPEVVSMACFLTPLGSRVEDSGWHRHDELDELCLVTGGTTTIIHAGSETRAVDGSLYLFRRGERHGYRNEGRQEPHLWVVHFLPDPAIDRECPGLAARDPARRAWRLDPERRDAFEALFLRLLAEQDGERRGSRAAASAWLRLMLVTAARWQEAEPAAPATPTSDPELLALWRLINDHVGAPADLAAAIRRTVPNYDSLRHRFRKVFKQSPRDLLVSLRMGRAKTLLLETDLPIGEVAERLGYARQHEFARAFRREVGCTPTWWREHAGDSRPPSE